MKKNSSVRQILIVDFCTETTKNTMEEFQSEVRNMATAVLEISAREEEIARKENKLEALKNTLLKKREELDTTKALVDGLRKELVADELASLSYNVVPSKSIVLTGLANRVDVTIPSQEYNTGTAQVPMTLLSEGKIKNFSEDVSGVFATYGETLAEKIPAFYGDKLEELRKFTFFFLPIDERRKVGFQNLPAYTYILIRFLLKNKIDVVVVDPRHSITDHSVRIINLSKVLDSLMAQNAKIESPFEETGDGLKAVLHCRGGEPTNETFAAINDATGLTERNIMMVRLVPGKVQNDFFASETCYKDFYLNVATCLHQFSMIDSYVKGENKTSIKKMYIILDEFSAYAAYLAVAAIAYDIDLIVLQYRRGRFVETPVPF